MISSMSKVFALGFGPGAEVNLSPGKKEGGPGSGPQAGTQGTEHEQGHRGARIYQSGNAVRALTPSGHNIGPFKNADLLKSHLDKNDASFGLSAKQTQADSATSTGVPQLRATKKKESAKKAWVPIHESGGDLALKTQNGSLFEVVLIKEGLGNFRDRYYYTKQCLQSAVESRLFEGTQSYADHPSEEEEVVRPERSTRDILGYYEDVNYSEGDGGQGQLVANLNISKAASLDWARELLTDAISYSQKFQESDLVGLSINASGAAAPMNIDEFISSQQLAPAVLAKLNEAKAQGVTEINVVNELREAQSVDLVTKAGAGGRILKMLEQEKRMFRNKFLRESEGEAGMKQKQKKEDGGAPAANDGATPDHADADQDKALFAQMIKQYLGKDDASPEEMEMAQHTHEACKEAGMEGKEAYEAAGQHLKMAMAVGKKMAQSKQSEAGESESEAEHGESESESEHEAESEAEAHEAEDGTAPIGKKGKQTPPTNAGKPSNGQTQESMRKYVALSGEVAKLRESVRRYELRDYLEDKIKKSGRPNSFTKAFRESLGAVRSKEQIDSVYKTFVAGWDKGATEVSANMTDGMFVERTHRESDGGSPRNVNFSDCLR